MTLCPAEWFNDALDANELRAIELQEQLHESEFGIWKQGDE